MRDCFYGLSDILSKCGPGNFLVIGEFCLTLQPRFDGLKIRLGGNSNRPFCPFFFREILSSTGHHLGSLDASKTGESGECPWVVVVGIKGFMATLPSVTPTRGHLVLSRSPVSLASRDLGLPRWQPFVLRQRSHGKIGDCGQLRKSSVSVYLWGNLNQHHYAL